METKTATPASTFHADTQAEWTRGAERAQIRESMEATGRYVAKRDTRLERELDAALTDFIETHIEESGLSRALAIVAANVHRFAGEYGKFGRQERFQLAAALFGLSEEAGKAGL